MIHFVAEKTHEYSCKNKLEKAILDFIKKEDRTLIPIRDLDEYKNRIIEELKEIQAKFPRCKPIRFEWIKSNFVKYLGIYDFRLDIGNGIVCYFYLRVCDDKMPF